MIKSNRIKMSLPFNVMKMTNCDEEPIKAGTTVPEIKH